MCCTPLYTELITYRHIIGQHKTLKRSATRTLQKKQGMNSDAHEG
jgi:hypothetical protein